MVLQVNDEYRHHKPIILNKNVNFYFIFLLEYLIGLFIKDSKETNVSRVAKLQRLQSLKVARVTNAMLFEPIETYCNPL